MGAHYYCSWLLGFLLPPRWEAEVAISAAALVVTIALLLVLDQTACATSPPSSTTEASRCRRQRRSRRAKRSKAAADELGRASEVRIMIEPAYTAGVH